MITRTLCFIAALAMAGCTTNEHNSGLPIVTTVLGVAGSTPGAGCTFTVGSPEVEFPIFNPAANNLATTGFVVKNQLTDTSALNAVLRTNSTSFTPHQAVVDYEIPGATVAQQIINVSGNSVASGSSVAVLVPLFSPTVVFLALPAAGGIVRTTTRIEGFLDDGSTVSTSSHDYVIQVSSAVASTPCF
jgi:hypothetical protein